MKIDIIGRGNVGSHLYHAFNEIYETKIINPHSLEGLNQDADFIIISVSDSAIPTVLAKLPKVKGIIAHTSGSTGINVFFENGLSGKVGVLYPLQTFSKNTSLDYSEIPFLIEASDSETEKALFSIASSISRNVRQADSSLRAKLHVAAVFSCNFVNHLWALSDEYLNGKNVEFSILLPLIKETVSKLSRLSPKEAQTGPAVRNDITTIQRHLSELEDYPALKKIYEMMTESIQRKKS